MSNQIVMHHSDGDDGHARAAQPRERQVPTSSGTAGERRGARYGRAETQEAAGHSGRAGAPTFPVPSSRARAASRALPPARRCSSNCLRLRSLPSREDLILVLILHRAVHVSNLRETNRVFFLQSLFFL